MNQSVTFLETSDRWKEIQRLHDSVAGKVRFCLSRLTDLQRSADSMIAAGNQAVLTVELESQLEQLKVKVLREIVRELDIVERDLGGGQSKTDPINLVHTCDEENWCALCERESQVRGDL